MRSVLIRRFEISDQLTHLFNALFWAVLAATGILIGSASRANVEPTHLSIGGSFCIWICACRAFERLRPFCKIPLSKNAF